MDGSNLRSANCIGRSLAYGGVAAAALALALCALYLHAGVFGLQLHEDRHPRHQIDRLEEDWRNAVLSSNTVALNYLLADDYMGITSFGTLQDKAQTLAGIRSGSIHFTTLDVFDRKVRFYGSAAVVTSRAEVRGTTPQGAIVGSYRYTHVYIRNPQGAWKIVSFEASRMRKAQKRK